MDLVRKFFSKSLEAAPAEPQKGPVHDIRVATCALFLEMAGIDGEFSESEHERIISTLKENYGLTDQCAVELASAAGEELEGSLDLWQFTNLINENYAIEEKLQVIELVWRIVYADGKLDAHEDYLVHKMANLLRLTHRQLIDAKMKVLREGTG